MLDHLLSVCARFVVIGKFPRAKINWTVTSLGRSRPAADAAREVTERWLLDGLDVSVGHRRFDNKNLANSIPTASNICLFSRLEGRKGSPISGPLVVLLGLTARA